jgi:hypothetical protein
MVPNPDVPARDIAECQCRLQRDAITAAKVSGMSKRTAVFLSEEIHRPGSGGEKRIDAGGIEGIARFVAQIGPRLVGAFDDAPGARQ